MLPLNPGEGPYDFHCNKHRDDTFTINGRCLRSDEFGNYIAGYQGEAYDSNVTSLVPALGLVLLAGIAYHVAGRTEAKNDPLDYTGAPMIWAGAAGTPDTGLDSWGSIKQQFAIQAPPPSSPIAEKNH